MTQGRNFEVISLFSLPQRPQRLCGSILMLIVKLRRRSPSYRDSTAAILTLQLYQQVKTP